MVARSVEARKDDANMLRQVNRAEGKIEEKAMFLGKLFAQVIFFS
jgi:hypothetical protein